MDEMWKHIYTYKKSQVRVSFLFFSWGQTFVIPSGWYTKISVRRKICFVGACIFLGVFAWEKQHMNLKWNDYSSLIAMKLFLYFRIKASAQHNLEQLFQINSLQSKFECVPTLSYSLKSCWISYEVAEESASYCSEISSLAEVSIIKMQSHILLQCRPVIRNWKI